MKYLYHILPEPRVGTHLLPLNKLRDVDEALYQKCYSKYNGREEVTKLRIPALDCFWNDVVFLTAVHPRDILSAFTDAGANLRRRKYLQFDLSLLDPELARIWLFTNDDKTDSDFRPLNTTELAQCDFIPQKTRAYYRRQAEAKAPIFVFAYVPHILYKGSLPFEKAGIVTV